MAEPAAARKKRSIQDIRDSKKNGERMVYTSVLDYTSAKWAEMAGVDVCVVGDSLAMTAHGHPNTVPATMDMMVLHSQAVRRGAGLAADFLHLAAQIGRACVLRTGDRFGFHGGSFPRGPGVSTPPRRWDR